MRVLITGGAGFVGSHLAEALLERGDEVFVLDDLSTGSIDNIVASQGPPQVPLHHRLGHQRAAARRADRSLRHRRPPGGRGRREADRRSSRSARSRRTCTAPRSCSSIANKKKKLVLIASTSEVYGKSTEVPFREDADLVLGPTAKHRWAYACSKMIDEFLALAYWKERKLPVIIVRLFNTVGPRQTGQYGMVDPELRAPGAAGQPITVFGDGTQSRSFTYVGDVVRAMVALIDEPRAIGQVFNIGNGEEITIGDLAVADQEHDRQHVARSSRSPTTRRTKPGSRTCRGGSRTSRKIRALVGLRADRRARRDAPRASSSTSGSCNNAFMPLHIKARARRTAEAVLRRQAKPIRQLLLATGRDRAPVLPEIVQIESTNICNAKCVFCPRDDMHRAQGIMSVELFKKIVDECAGARHHARAHAQLRRGVPRRAPGREGALREAEGHQGSRHDQQRLADHREGRARA